MEPIVQRALIVVLTAGWLGFGCASASRRPSVRPHNADSATVETFEQRYARLMQETRPPVRDAVRVSGSGSADQTFEQRYAELISALREADAVPNADADGGDIASVPTGSAGAGSPSVMFPPRTPTSSSAITIQPEAVLNISVEEDPALNGNYPVNEIGAINLGYIGPIILFNRTEAEAADKIRDVLIGRAFKHATVKVELLRASYDRVEVAGSVNRPGLIRIGSGDAISLNDALLRAGGLRGTARGMQVRILRGGMTDAMAMALEGEVYSMLSADGEPAVPEVWLSNNDKAVIFSSRTEAVAAYGDKEIMVLGEVNRKGIIRFSGAEPCTVMHLIFKMGGFPQYANRRALRILRIDASGVEREIIVNAERIMETGHPDDDVPLEHGDRIIVPARRLSLF